MNLLYKMLADTDNSGTPIVDDLGDGLTFFQNLWEKVKNWFLSNGGWQFLVRIALTVIIGFLIIKLILSIINKIVARSKLKDQKLAGRFIYNIAKVALLVIYFIAVLTVLGIDTSSLVAVLAASSLAVSLALQSIMTNFASGMIIVGNKPFKEGDYISVGDYSGTVTNITLHSTTLVTPDNKVVIIPNSDISGGTVVNYSAMPERRLDLEFTVAYGTNVEKVKKVLTKVLEEHPLVFHEKDYNVRLSAEDASALRFICRCWVKNEDYWTVNFDLHENVVAAFKKANIEIPFNQLDVNIKK